MWDSSQSISLFGAGSGLVMVKSPFWLIWKDLQIGLDSFTIFLMTILMVAIFFADAPLIIIRSVDISSILVVEVLRSLRCLMWGTQLRVLLLAMPYGLKMS